MELNSQYIGSLIKSLRKRAGLTQNELALRIGVGNKTVSKWEQGRGIPDISILPRLSLELDVDIESILAGNLEDLGKEWIGIIQAGEVITESMSGQWVLEYLISMFLLVGIRDIAFISASDKKTEKNEIFLKRYQEKGILRKICFVRSAAELGKNAEFKKKHICFLYQPAFLYGMHLTRYIRRAMISGKTTVLAIRQGQNSFMPKICFENGFVCISSSNEQLFDTEWHMFPMIFCDGKYSSGCLEVIGSFQGDNVNVKSLLEYFKEICVEPVERGMLAFSFLTREDRELTEEVLTGIEKSQHIKIGNLQEIMRVRGWM